MPTDETKRKVFSFLRFSKHSHSSQSKLHSTSQPLNGSTLAPSAPIPLRPEHIPLPGIDRGPSGTTSLYSTFPTSFLPSNILPTSSHAQQQEEATTTYGNTIGNYPTLSQSRSQRSCHAQTGTPDGLPSHLSLSTMGFGNSPFRIDYSSPRGATTHTHHMTPREDTYVRTSAVWPPMDDFGRIITSTRRTSLPKTLESRFDQGGSALADAEEGAPVADHEKVSGGGFPTLASAIHISDSDSASDRRKSRDTGTVSTWRIPRSISRSSIFETWGHSHSRDRPRISKIPLAPDASSPIKGKTGVNDMSNANNAIERTSSISRGINRVADSGSGLRRKMSIDSIVQTLSRRRSQAVPGLPTGPSYDSGENNDTRRWTAINSQTSDDSISHRASIVSGAPLDVKSGRMVMPAMRSMRSKFSLGISTSKASSLSKGSRSVALRGSGSTRLSSLFQRPTEAEEGDPAPASDMSASCTHDSLYCTHANQPIRRQPIPKRSVDLSTHASSLTRLELEDVQAMVEITKTPVDSPSPPLLPPSPTSPPARQPNLKMARQASAVASTLTVPLSPARDDVSILDPHRTPMIASFSVHSLHQALEPYVPIIAGVSTVERSDGTADPSSTPRPADVTNQLGERTDINATDDLLPCDSRNVIVSTFSSLRTMSEFASSDSSESLAAKMKQSLSELKSAFKRMRNMSDVDLSSLSTSNRDSGHESEGMQQGANSSASSEELVCADQVIQDDPCLVEKAWTDDDDHGKISGSANMAAMRTFSSKNLANSMKWKDSTQSFDTKMSCFAFGDFMVHCQGGLANVHGGFERKACRDGGSFGARGSMNRGSAARWATP